MDAVTPHARRTLAKLQNWPVVLCPQCAGMYWLYRANEQHAGARTDLDHTVERDRFVVYRCHDCSFVAGDAFLNQSSLVATHVRYQRWVLHDDRLSSWQLRDWLRTV